MGIIVHGSYFSPYVLQVLIALEELGVDYEFKVVNMKEGEHRTPEYLKMQPFVKVPVVQDGDVTVFGKLDMVTGCSTPLKSRAITKYLAEKFEGHGTPLLGKTVKEKVLVSQWVEVESKNYDRPLMAIVSQVVVAPFFGRETNAEVVEEGMAKLDKVLDPYEAHLGKHKHLAGDVFSLADLSHLVGTYLLVNTGKKGAQVFAGRSHMKAWRDISKRPSFKKIIALFPSA